MSSTTPIAPPPPPVAGEYIPAGLLTPENLYDYQRECVLHMLYHDDSMLWLQMGLGKEQPHSEPVLTPDGWSTMGDIRPGAHVIGSDGRPVKVLAKFPQGEKEVVKVTFNDGSWVRCGWDHLFTVYSEHQRFKGLPGTARTLRDLHDSGLTKRNGKNGTMLKWSIPLVAPVQFPDADLPIDPYTLGILLGDGHTSEDSGVTLCTDIETLHRVGATCITPHETSTYSGYGYLPVLKQKLRDVDLLGRRSWEKFVPEEYMLAAVPQRLSLLQGLLDSDGSPIAGGGVEFSSTSEALADAVVELSNSLGGIARKKGPRVTRHQNGEGRPSWRVNVKLPSDMSPFTLSRKLAKWVRPTKYHALRKIASIEPCGYSEESSCILVDAPDHLYVTRHHVVTHNTPITLTTVVDRMRAGQVRKTLIFGPLRVIQAVWAREARKWSHTRHLRFSVLHGTKEKRTRALFSDADIYLCNYEAMNWLAETLDHYYLSQGKPLPFEMCVYDEVSKMKNSTSLRMSGGNRDRKDRRGEVYKIKVVGWRKILPHFKYRVGLTGTPASNGYLDLHGQYLAVDGGKRLGEYITHFKDSYFTSDYNGWKYTPTEIGKQWIEYQISDITKKMDAADYLDLPECRTVNVMVDLPPKARKAYDEMEKAMFTQLETGSEVEVFSRSSVSNKCLQFCNGTPYYGETQEWEALHDAKLDALEDILEEAAGAPVLCSYTFKSDAERILKKFKKYNPVNLTAVPSKDTEKYIDKWNRGEIKLMIGHPACLHPSTQVLTELRGWIKIVDVTPADRVFDGVEFVNHDGCSYSGYKDVIDTFGITMTPDHKLLIGNEWVEARDVGDSEEIRRKALYQYEGDDSRIGEMFALQDGVQDYSSKCSEAQSAESDTLPTLCRGSVSQYDWHQDSQDLVRSEVPIERPIGSKLCGPWHRTVRRVAGLLKVLRRHVAWVRGPSDDRAKGCERSVLEGQLHLGYSVRPARQQANNPAIDLPGGGNPLGRIGAPVRCQQDDVDHATQSRDDRRRSSARCAELPLREKSQPKEHRTSKREKAHVYDIVNCGPRHQFLIRNDDGEMFISHNSMGHGVDGLQQSGSILVWFGVNWSLELYEQMNGRLDRQGQKAPVSIIRILCRDSVDLAVADAIERKVDDQEGLKSALQRYRDGVTTNDLEVNFF